MKTINVSSYVMLSAVFAFYMIAFYPGYLSPDSVYMLDMSTGRQPVSNWHPLFDIAVWRFFIRLFNGHAEGLWVLQTVAWLKAAWQLSREFPRVQRPLFAALTLLPPITANMAALWKDCQAIILTTFCTAYTLYYLRTQSGRAAILCVVFAALASRVRLDYPIIVLPMLVACAPYFQRFCTKTPATLNALGLFATVYGVSMLVSPRVEQPLHSWLPLAAWDIAGINARTDQGDLTILNRNVSHTQIVRHYNCVSSDPLLYDTAKVYPHNMDGFLFPGNLTLGPHPYAPDDERRAYLEQWHRSILEAPAAFLAHRLCVFSAFLTHVHYAMPYGVFPADNAYFQHQPSIYEKDLHSIYVFLSKMPIWSYQCYFLIASAAWLYLKRRGEHQRAATMIFASVIGTAARALLVLPAIDFRYGLWICIGTILLISLLAETLIEVVWSKSQSENTS